MKVQVLSGMCPIHDETVAMALNCGVSTDPIAEWVIVPFVDPRNKNLWKAAESGRRLVAYWIGNDSRWIKEGKVSLFDLPKFEKHLVNHERLKANLPCPTEVLPFVVRQAARDPIKTDRPFVAVYMPTISGNYRFEMVCEIAETLPDLEFAFYGSTDLLHIPVNCTNMGRLTPDGVTMLIAGASALLRMTDHDGFPGNVIEAKMCGKNAITSYPYEGCLHAANETEAIELLKDPRTHEPDLTDWPAWYQNNCSPEAFKRNFMKMIGE